MRLQIDDRIYMVHFHHEAAPRPPAGSTVHKMDCACGFCKAGFTKARSGLWWEETYCTIHEGECAKKERPCDTPGACTGIAHCSTKDRFTKAVGRKLAFGRAVSAFTIDWGLRAKLWKSYLDMFPPETTKHNTPKSGLDAGGAGHATVGSVPRSTQPDSTPIRP